MTGDDRKIALLDELRLERGASGRNLPRKRIMFVLLGSCSLLAGMVLLYEQWPATAVSLHAVAAMANLERTGSILDASGYVVARRKATLSAKILGKLIEIPVEEGDQVTDGQVVARLDDSNYAAVLAQSKASVLVARALLIQARVAFDDTAPNYARYRALLAQGAISAEAVDSQKAKFDAARTAITIAERNLAVARAAVAVAQANESDTIVRAPFAGIVTEKAAQPGEIVAPAAAGGGFTRTGIATIVDMDSLEIQVDVSESNIDRVHPGQKAMMRLNAYPDWEIPGSVTAIIPTADETKGSVKVRLGTSVRDKRILPQMGARVAFLSSQASRASGVLIPTSAIIHGKEGQAVFVIGRDGRLRLRSVEAGAVRQGMTVVSTGLAPGERVALGDVNKLHDGLNVRVEP